LSEYYLLDLVGDSGGSLFGGKTSNSSCLPLGDSRGDGLRGDRAVGMKPIVSERRLATVELGRLFMSYKW